MTIDHTPSTTSDNYIRAIIAARAAEALEKRLNRDAARIVNILRGGVHAYREDASQAN